MLLLRLCSSSKLNKNTVPYHLNLPTYSNHDGTQYKIITTYCRCYVYAHLSYKKQCFKPDTNTTGFSLTFDKLSMAHSHHMPSQHTVRVTSEPPFCSMVNLRQPTHNTVTSAREDEPMSPPGYSLVKQLLSLEHGQSKIMAPTSPQSYSHLPQCTTHIIKIDHSMHMPN